MSRAAHTPGPWFVSPYKSSNGITTRANGKYEHRIAETCQWSPARNGQPDAKTAAANARLIAAAPALVAALQELAPELRIMAEWTSGPTSEEYAAKYERARAALSLALGEQ